MNKKHDFTTYSILLLPISVLLLTTNVVEAQEKAGERGGAGGLSIDAPRLVRRVIVLRPTSAIAISPQTQIRADQTAQKIMAARQKKQGRRRVRRAPAPPARKAGAQARSVAPLIGAGEGTAVLPDDSPGVNAILRATAGDVKAGQATRKNPPSGNPGVTNQSIRNGSIKNAKSGAGETVSPEQQNALAQVLLSDLVAERLRDRLGLIVAPDAEVEAALNMLGLRVSDLENSARPENARRLCALLRCQAVFIPRLTGCALHDGLTRDVSLWARVTIHTLPASSAPGSETGRAPAGRQEGEGVEAQRWPARIEVAGAAFAERVIFHSRYQKPQADLIRDAAVQAANLLAHALQANETAPLMRRDDRLAAAPVPAPTQSDVLVFTARGRRVYPDAARGLDGDASALWTPYLLPLADQQIADTEAVRQALNAEGRTPAFLWKDAYQPDINRVQALARRLHVTYVLLARVTDVEISEGARDASAVAAFEESTNESLRREPQTKERAPERAARAEALALLVRAGDGAVVWRERGTATMTRTANDGYPAQSDAALVRDASHFALIELARRFRHWRADFEK